MRRVFLDVGANKGQTLEAVIDPALEFDRIFCFEPARICWDHLEKIVREEHPRAHVKIERFGLWNQNGEFTLFGDGTQGASIWHRENRNNTTQCQFRRASEWIGANIYLGDQVFMKLNVEGAECDILDDLLDSGEFEKVSHVMVDFDVRKIPSQRHREPEIRRRLDLMGIEFPRVAFSKDVMRGDTHADRIRHWLRAVGV